MKTDYFDVWGAGRRFDHHLTKIVTVRLSDWELRILERNFPGVSLSYQIRSVIHALEQKGGHSRDNVIQVPAERM